MRSSTPRAYRSVTCAGLALCCLLAIPAALAQTHPSSTSGSTASLPPLGPPKPLCLPAIVQKELPNGLKLVVLEDHRQPAIWLRLVIGAGSLRDPGDRIGLANMTATMLDKGTTTRTESQIADKVDGLGANLGATTNQDHLTVSASGLSTYTDDLFDLLTDITLHPTFPTQELERTRTRELSSIIASLGQPSVVADAAIHRRVYGAHPYGNFAAGTPVSLKEITQQDLAQFHDRLFVPNNATLFVVGDITAEQAESKAQAQLGAWQRREVAAPPGPPSASTPSTAGPQITIVDRPGAAQTEVRIGLLTTGYSDPKRQISRVATAVLGLGQFEGRLTKEIRVKRGLTYGAVSFFDRKAEAGIFEITTFTKNQSTGEVLKIALEQARKLQTEAVPAEELADRKAFLNGSFAVSVATTPGVLRRLVPAVVYGTGPGELTRYIPDIQAVTSDQIEQYMRSLDLAKPQIVLVGDASAIEPQVKSMGTVTTIPAGSLDPQSPTLRGQSSAPAGDSSKPGQVGSDADGKARLASAVAALGGDAFLNLKQITMKGEGEINPPGQEVKVPIASATLIFAPPGRSRFELNTTFGDVIFGNDGSSPAWLSALGAVQDAPTGFGDPTQLLRRAVQSGFQATSLPDVKGQADGEPPLQGFALMDDKSRTTRIFLDAVTHLPRRIIAQSGQGVLDIWLGDYHAEGAVKLPGSLKVTQDGKPFVTLKFTAWSVNNPVNETLFVRPKS